MEPVGADRCAPSENAAHMPFRHTRFLTWIIALCAAALAASAAERPYVIAIVRDTNSWFGDSYETKVRHSIEEMAAGRCAVSFVEQAADAADDAALRAGFERALADPGVDYVLALGPRALRLAGDPALPLTKPVLGAAFVDPDLQTSPLDAAGHPTKANFAIVVLSARTSELLARLRETVSFSAVQLLVDDHWAGGAAEIEAWRRGLANSLGAEVRVVRASETATSALAALDRAVPAVFMLPSGRLGAAEHAALLDGLRTERFLALSYLGQAEVEAGALAGVLPAAGAQLARRTALVFDELTSGTPVEQLELTAPWRPGLYFNEATAAAAGFAPKFGALSDATLVGTRTREGEQELRFRDALALALERNYALRARAAGTDASREDVKAAAGQLLPQVAAVSTYQRIDLDRAQASGGIIQEKTWFAGLGVSQPLIDDEAWTRVRLARAALEAANALERVQRLDTVAQTAQAYLQALAARAALRVTEQNARTIARHLELAQLRQRTGVSGPEDILRFESLTAQQRSETIAARSRLEQARTALNRVLGVEADAQWTLRDVALGDPEFAGLTAPLTGLIDDRARFGRLRQYLVAFATGHSPDLAAAEQGVTAQRLSAEQKVRRSYVPKVSATANAGRLVELDYGGPTLTEQLLRAGLPVTPVDVNRFTWTVGVQATLPLYAGGSLTADRRRARAQLRQLEYTRDGAREAIVAAAQAVLQSIESSYSDIALSRTSAELAERNLAVVRDKYEQGTVSIVTLLEAQTAAFARRQAAEVALYRFLGDVVQLERVCGRFEALSTGAENAAWLAEIEAAIAQ